MKIQSFGNPEQQLLIKVISLFRHTPPFKNMWQERNDIHSSPQKFAPLNNQTVFHNMKRDLQANYSWIQYVQILHKNYQTKFFSL